MGLIVGEGNVEGIFVPIKAEQRRKKKNVASSNNTDYLSRLTETTLSPRGFLLLISLQFVFLMSLTVELKEEMSHFSTLLSGLGSRVPLPNYLVNIQAVYQQRE